MQMAIGSVFVSLHGLSLCLQKNHPFALTMEALARYEREMVQNEITASMGIPPSLIYNNRDVMLRYEGVNIGISRDGELTID
jgi:hypothetical protein